jgi:hypothetical protein
MHVTLSWDISATGERWKAIDDQLVAAIKPHSWVRPLKTVYVVKLSSEAERKALQDRLVAVAQSVAENVRFLLTPLMSGGTYNGYLASDAWVKIAERTS